MEPESSKAEARPPALIDAAVRVLIPPACREHVVGDLWERYRSPRHFVVDALRTVPFVIASRIRRTSNLAFVLTNAMFVFFFFSDLPGNRDGLIPPAWVRALVPAFAAIVALSLRDAYRSPKPKRWVDHAVDAFIATAGAMLSQLVLAAVGSDWAIPQRAVVSGSGLTFGMLFLLRAPAEHESRPLVAAGGTMSADELRKEVQRFERRIQLRNRREGLAAILVLLGGSVVLWRAPGPAIEIGTGLLMAATIFIMYRLLTRGTTRPVPMDVALQTSVAIYRRELERQRDLLQGVFWWYLLPMLPGALVLTIGQPFARLHPAPAMRVLGSFLMLCVLGWVLNWRAASKLQRKIDALAPLEKPGP